MKKSPALSILSLLCILSAAVFLSGCGSPGKDRQIMQTSTWCFGINVAATDAATGTPKVQIGAVKTTVTYLPTSTNGMIYAPRFASSYRAKQSTWNPTAADTADNLMAGDVMIGTNAESSAIVPKSGPAGFFQSAQ